MSNFSAESAAAKSEWQQVYRAVSRLASIQRESPASPATDVDPEPVKESSAQRIDDHYGVKAADSEQLAQAIQEITQAADALQSAQPGLGAWIKQDTSQGRQPKALLLLICVLWWGTTLTVLGFLSITAFYLL
jgi:hypothetical protein